VCPSRAQIRPLLGFVAFVAALALQFRTARYRAWTYWLTVAMVGVFDLGAVFWTWNRFEHTLSMHSIGTPRREAFYWAAVAATFAMGMALGDLTAYTLHLGYWSSVVLFTVLIPLSSIAHRWRRLGRCGHVLGHLRADPSPRRHHRRWPGQTQERERHRPRRHPRHSRPDRVHRGDGGLHVVNRSDDPNGSATKATSSDGVR
jgi:hypothetical protein